MPMCPCGLQLQLIEPVNLCLPPGHAEQHSSVEVFRGVCCEAMDKPNEMCNELL